MGKEEGHFSHMWVGNFTGMKFCYCGTVKVILISLISQITYVSIVVTLVTLIILNKLKTRGRMISKDFKRFSNHHVYLVKLEIFNYIGQFSLF